MLCGQVVVRAILISHWEDLVLVRDGVLIMEIGAVRFSFLFWRARVNVDGVLIYV